MKFKFSINPHKMFVSILVSALLVVCPAIAITLPNGFTFDEKLHLQIESRANYALESCEHANDGCSNDCSTQLICEGHKVMDPTNSYLCDQNMPYCVKNSGPYSMCSGNFPMTSQACLTKATNNFICTEDGHFPDPTDCSKYHVCNGTAHSIVECPASHQFTFDQNIEDPYMNPGNGEFSCRFRKEYENCMCDRFYCYGNSFSFRPMDAFHYAYCLEIGTLKKIVMFKCPKGTRHNGGVTMENTVDCFPIGAPIV